MARQHGWTLAQEGAAWRVKQAEGSSVFSADDAAHLYVWERAQEGDPLCSKALAFIVIVNSEEYQSANDDPLVTQAGTCPQFN